MLNKIYSLLFNPDAWLDDAQIKRYFRKKPSANNNIEIKDAIGSTTLQFVISDYNLQPSKTILTPLCIEYSLFGFDLNHWTLLEISKDNQGSVHATLHDSMGWWRKLRYMIGIPSLLSVEETICFHFPRASFQVECYGHQADTYSCGKFVIGYIEQLSKGEEISDPAERFSDIQSVIDQPEAEPNIPEGAEQPARENSECFQNLVQNQQPRQRGPNL